MESKHPRSHIKARSVDEDGLTLAICFPTLARSAAALGKLLHTRGIL